MPEHTNQQRRTPFNSSNTYYELIYEAQKRRASHTGVLNDRNLARILDRHQTNAGPALAQRVADAKERQVMELIGTHPIRLTPIECRLGRRWNQEKRKQANSDTTIGDNAMFHASSYNELRESSKVIGLREHLITNQYDNYYGEVITAYGVVVTRMGGKGKACRFGAFGYVCVSEEYTNASAYIGTTNDQHLVTRVPLDTFTQQDVVAAYEDAHDEPISSYETEEYSNGVIDECIAQWAETVEAHTQRLLEREEAYQHGAALAYRLDDVMALIKEGQFTAAAEDYKEAEQIVENLYLDMSLEVTFFEALLDRDVSEAEARSMAGYMGI